MEEHEKQNSSQREHQVQMARDRNKPERFSGQEEVSVTGPEGVSREWDRPVLREVGRGGL